MKTWARRLSIGLLAAGVVFWFSGCLSAKYFAMVRYDEAKDEFTFLNVYQRISTATPGDSQYLYQLWRNRDHLIRLPNVDIFTMPAFLRMSQAKYVPINLGEAPPKLEAVETAISLDQIRILPGTFFLRGADTLCYYDQVVLPGKVIDQALPMFAKTVAPAMTEAIDKEVQRRKDGGKTVEWAKYRRELMEGLHSAANPTTVPATAAAGAEPKIDPMQVLDDESLQLLRKGVADGSMTLTREKQVFRFILPLSNADARQVDQTWHALLHAIKTEAPKATPETPTLAAMAKLQSAFALSTRPNAVELKINLAIIIDQLPEIASMTKPLSDPTPQELKSMRDTITALRAQGAPIDEKLTVEQLAKDFLTGTVKSYPSDHPIEPGTGLAQAPPAKK